MAGSQKVLVLAFFPMILVLLTPSLVFAWVTTSTDVSGSQCDVRVRCTFDGDDWGMCNDRVTRVVATYGGQTRVAEWASTRWCPGPTTTCYDSPQWCDRGETYAPGTEQFPVYYGPGSDTCQLEYFSSEAPDYGLTGEPFRSPINIPEEFIFTNVPGDGTAQCRFEVRVDADGPGTCSEYSDTATSTDSDSTLNAQCCGEGLPSTCGDPQRKRCYSNFCYTCSSATEGENTIFWRDADGDGYDDGTWDNFCDPPGAGWTATHTALDCNDGNAARNPGATEICGNSIDENCDGLAPSCTVPPPEPTPCSPSTTISIVPSTQNAFRTDTKTYAVNVTNGNGASCSSSTTYTLSQSCPSGITCSINPTSLTIIRGTSDTATLSATVANTATYQTYLLSVSATGDNPSSSNDASASLVVQETTATFCSSYPNSGTCEGQSYCDWFSNKCEGSPSPCSTWGNSGESTCEDATHKTSASGAVCQWREYCEGSIADCEDYSASSCPTSGTGCYVEAAYCTPRSCPSSESACRRVDGCHVNMDEICGDEDGDGEEDDCVEVYGGCSGTPTCSVSGSSCTQSSTYCTYHGPECEGSRTDSCSDYASAGNCPGSGVTRGCTFRDECEGSRAACSEFTSSASTCASNQGCGATVSNLPANKSGYSADFDADLNRPGSYYIPAHCEGALCSNNRREGPTVYNSYSEYCDGTDLAGHRCSQYVCGDNPGTASNEGRSGNKYQHGSVSCVSACNAVDTTQCWGDYVAPTASGNYNYGPDGENGWYKNNIRFTLNCDSTPDNSCHGSLGSHACETYWCEGAGCNPLTGTRSFTGTTSGEGTIVIRYQARDTDGLTSAVGELKQPATSSYPKVDKTPPTLSDLYLDADEVFGYPYENITRQGVTINMQTKAVDPTGADVISGLNETSLYSVVRIQSPTNANYATLPITRKNTTIYYDYWTIPAAAPNDRYYVLYSMKDNAGNWRSNVDALNNFMWVGKQDVRVRFTHPSPVQIPVDGAGVVSFTVENMMDEPHELNVLILDPNEAETPERFWVRFITGKTEERYSIHVPLGKYEFQDFAVSVKPGKEKDFVLQIKGQIEGENLDSFANTTIDVVPRTGTSFFVQSPEPTSTIAIVILLALATLFFFR